MTSSQILEEAADILAAHYVRDGNFCNPQITKHYHSCKQGKQEREVFAVTLLDNQHQLIEFKELFYGTIDGASVYPREVVKAAIKVNAAAVTLAYNHPSGIAEPSSADKRITAHITEALSTVDIRVLDHLVVGGCDIISLAERGLI